MNDDHKYIKFNIYILDKQTRNEQAFANVTAKNFHKVLLPYDRWMICEKLMHVLAFNHDREVELKGSTYIIRIVNKN